MDRSQGARPDPGQIADLDALVQSLHRLRVWSGNPSLRTLAKQAGPLLRPPRVLSHTTLAHLFQPDRRRLDLDLVLAVVRALGLDEGEVDSWRTAWFRVHAGARSAEPAVAVNQLPADLATFTGREPELRAIVGGVDGVGGFGGIGDGPTGGSTVVISAIDGMAGVGKSALAVRAAHLLSGRFPDGQLFLDLHGYTQGMAPRDPADALASVLASLGVLPGKIPADLDARAAAFRARLAGTRTLILLDNAATEAQVRPLIPGQGGCLVLITSRRRLKALDEARSVALDVLPEADAVALLRALVEPARAPEQDPGWRQIAELCGCLPLALRIAAALIRHRPAWTLGHLADKLSATPLDLGTFTDGERDLTAVFDLSYQTLADDRRELLRRLGLIPGAGSDTDAYAAAALLDTDPARAERLLQDLVDHHLLTEPAAGRYRMHDLIRAYAHAQATALDPEPERDRALSRLLHYYAHTAQSASHAITRFPRPEPSGPAPAHLPDLREPDSARAWLRAELPNLDAAFAHARAHRLDGHTVALAAGLADILHTDGPWTHALDLHHTAAETAQRLGQPGAHANALTDLGRVRQLTGDYAGAGDAHARALEIFRALGDRVGEAGALTDLGRVHYLTGDYSGAGDPLTGALEIYRALGDRGGEAGALTDLGRVRTMTGHYPEAGDALSRALEVHHALGDRNGEAGTLTDLGRVRYLTGDYPGSDDAVTRALEIYRALGNPNGEAGALSDLGRVRQATEDYPGADDALTRALEIYRALGNLSGQASALTELGRVRTATGRYPEADDALTRALELFRETGERGNEAWALNYYAAVIATSDRPRALALYRQALALNRELDKPDDEAISLEGIADHHLAAGDTDQGTAHLRQSLDIYRHLGMNADIERVQARLASIAPE